MGDRSSQMVPTGAQGSLGRLNTDWVDRIFEVSEHRTAPPQYTYTHPGWGVCEERADVDVAGDGVRDRAYCNREGSAGVKEEMGKRGEGAAEARKRVMN